MQCTVFDSLCDPLPSTSASSLGVLGPSDAETIHDDDDKKFFLMSSTTCTFLISRFRTTIGVINEVVVLMEGCLFGTNKVNIRNLPCITCMCIGVICL